MITALAGGVGAARFLRGLVEIIPQEDLTVIVNTGDDIELHGLYISPDIDIIMYTLAGMVDEGKGWGIRGDTFHCLEMLGRYGCETWFNLGDKDLACHIYRTYLLRKGLTLSEVTEKISKALGLRVNIIPMTNQRFRTIIVTDNGRMHFQEYLVKRRARDRVIHVEFEGVDEANPAPGVLDSILNSDAIIICPSNPIVSIGTILSIRKVKDAIERSEARVVAISPIVGGAPIKGPADKLMRALGYEVSAYGVAEYYRSLIDAIVIDRVDESERLRIESLGIKVAVTDTIMKSLQSKIQLAKFVLDLIRELP